MPKTSDFSFSKKVYKIDAFPAVTGAGGHGLRPGGSLLAQPACEARE